jgi:hypothetical protein
MHADRTWKASARWFAALMLIGVLGSVSQSRAQSAQEGTSRAPGMTGTEVRAVPEHDAQVTARIMELEREIDALRVAGRPGYFHRRRALGRAALILGVLAVTSGAMIGAYVASIHSEDAPAGSSQGLSPGAKALIGVPIGAGLMLIGGGTWTLITLRKSNANQGRIDALRDAQRALTRQRAAMQ